MAPTYGKSGVQIVSLSLGIIGNKMGQLEHSENPEMANMIALTPLQRMDTTPETASIVLFLASVGGSYMRSTDIIVDCGCVAGINQAGGLRRASG